MEKSEKVKIELSQLDSVKIKIKKAKWYGAFSHLPQWSKIYICHEYAANPLKNQMLVRGICKEIKKINKGLCLYAPEIYLAQFVENENLNRADIMNECLEMLRICNYIFVFTQNNHLSAGMIEEIEFASTRKGQIPVYFLNYEEEENKTL